jgi:hypothetical protein
MNAKGLLGFVPGSSRQCISLLVAITCFTAVSLCQVTNTVTQGTYHCPATDSTGTTYTYTNWAYKDSVGASHQFPGSTIVLEPVNSHQRNGPSCPGSTSSLDTYAGDGTYFLTARGATGSVATAERGYVNPKFIVVGVTYAPPGPSTNTYVEYLNSTFVGVTNSLSQSFGNSSTQSVSLSYGFSIPLVANGKITVTNSTTNGQTTKTTSTVTSSVNVQSGEQTFGTGNYFAPVDNDYDQIWVWLNPAVIFSVAGSEPPQWNGYGFDGTDENQLDIVPIALGYLNGDFGAMPADIQSRINRTWAASQLPAGQDPALTSSDLAQIAAADPFSVSTYGTTYIGYDPPATQTSDYRFTTSLCNGSSGFNYLQASPSTSPNVFQCNLTYTNLSTQASDITTMYSQTFTLDIALQGTAFFSNFSADLKDSYTLTWTKEAQSSITTSTTSLGSLFVQGPPCNNVVQGQGPCVPVYDASGTEPTQYQVYEDNVYGTFMFAPVHYY